MKVTEIIVSAGRTFNHPFENYSNLKPMVTLKATLDDGDDPDHAVRQLQAKTESLVEDHKALMLAQLQVAYSRAETQREVESLEKAIRRAQDRLTAIRNGEEPAAIAVVNRNKPPPF